MNKALLLFAALAFCAKSEVKMEWKAPFGGRAEAGHEVVAGAEGWTKLWKEIGKPAPEADLEKHIAIAVFMGPRNTGGYAVVWDAPKEEKARVLVRYTIAPPKGMAMQALTQPWAVRLFPKSAKPYAVELKK